MTIRQGHDLEVSDGAATLYLTGTLTGADVFSLRRLCREIPDHVHTLRLDLHGVTQLQEGAMDTVRALVRYWRESRNGRCRLSFASEYLVATFVDGSVTEPPKALADPFGGRAAALTGMFL